MVAGRWTLQGDRGRFLRTTKDPAVSEVSIGKAVIIDAIYLKACPPCWPASGKKDVDRQTGEKTA